MSATVDPSASPNPSCPKVADDDCESATTTETATSLSPIGRATWFDRLAWLGDGLISLLYPPTCPLCGGGCEQAGLCVPCRDWFAQEAATDYCQRCGASIGPYVDRLRGCDRCPPRRFAFARVLRLGSYHDRLADACLRAKESWNYRVAVTMADLLFEARREEWSELRIDCVTAVPRDWMRTIRRGYNQADGMARRLAQRLGKRHRPSLLRRARRTAPQSRLPGSNRRQNVRNAFLAGRGKALNGQSILLVDDILTTGATCHEAARVLRRQGAAAVFVAVAARGENILYPANPSSNR